MIKHSPYIERTITRPFDKLKPDEQIVAHWALVYKELIKFNFSSLLEYDLDDINTIKQMEGLSSDKKGGVDWFNYMYSDQYKDNEDLKKDNIEIGGKDPNYWARLSIFEALERFCVYGFGSIVVPPVLLNYVKECRKNGEIPDGNIFNKLEKYQEAERVCKLLSMHTKISPEAILLMIASCGTENSWEFKGTVINTHERDGKSDNAGTHGMENCGEGWFGITFWSTKIKIINALNLPCAKTPEGYRAHSGKWLAELSDLEWCKITEYWVNKLLPEKHAKIIGKKEKPKTPDDWEALICSCWLFKAGPAGDPNLEGAKKIQDNYSKWQMNNLGKVNFNSFAVYVYQAMLLSKYFEDPTKVPKLDF